MIRIKVMIFALLFAILGQPIAAIASDVTNALYSGTIVISNNSTANTNVATTANISTDNLITGQYLNATANNTVVRNSSGADVPFQPGYTDANLWSFWVSSIGTDSYLTYILYTANSTGGEIRYFPGPTGMTTIDSAGLELLGGTTNFSIKQGGFTATSVNSSLLEKGVAAIDIKTGGDDIMVGIRTTEPIRILINASAAWVDVDLSDYIPPEATGVILQVVANTKDCGFRKNGSTDARTQDMYHNWVMIGVDANQVLEAYIEDATVDVYLWGYTDSSWTFKTNAEDISLPGAVAWVDIDVTAITSTECTGVVVEVVATVGAQVAGLRNDGSADARQRNLNATSHIWYVVGVDTATEIFEGWAQDATIDFYLVGYVTAGSTFRVNGFDKSLGVPVAWTDIDSSAQAPSATFLFFEVDQAAAGPDDFGFQPNGSSFEVIEAGDFDKSYVITSCDTGQIVEGYVATVNLDFWLQGYATSGVYLPYISRVVASDVTVAEHDLDVAREDEPAMSTWANDVNVGVNMGNGILPVKLIEEQTLDAAVASVTFSDIGTKVALWDSLAGVTSRHLVVMVNAKSPDAVAKRSVEIQFNGDAAANYNHQTLTGENVAADADARTGLNYMLEYPGGTDYPFAIPGTTYANAFGGGTILIPHAFNTTNHKSVIAQGGASEDYVSTVAGRWASINAITGMVFTLDTGNFDTGSTFTLGVVDERYLVEEQLLAVAGAIDFQNISADGHDLVVIGYPQSDAAAVEDEILHEINNDGGAAAYPVQELTGRAAAKAASQPVGDEIGMTSGDNAGANEFGAFLATYSQYAESTNQVHFTSLSGYHESTIPTSEVRAMSGRWANVAAITRLEFYPATAPNDFLPGSLFSLYRVPRYVISRQELTAATPTITFANTPQEYQALQLNIYARSSDAIPISDEVAITINTDAGPATFDWQYLEGTGAGPPTALRSAASNVLMVIPAAGEGANEFGGGTVIFPRYERTDGHKHFITLSGTNENQVILRSSRWENLAAITRIDLDPVNGVNFAVGSVFELVGIMPTKVLDIDVDGDIKGLADGNFAIPNTTDDWDFVEAAAMPYMEYHEITINGTLQQDIVWEYDSVFHDTSHYGVEFDGVNDFITVADDVSLNPTTAISIELWIKPSNIPFSTFEMFLSKTSAQYEFYGLNGDDEIRCTATFGVGAQNLDTVDANLVADTWYHIVMTYDKVNWNIYVNGVLRANSGAQTTDLSTNAVALEFGRRWGGGLLYVGGTDEVRIYNRALGLPEVQANYNSGVGTYTPYSTTGIVGWWHMEEGAGLTTADSSGNGNTGTLTNGPRWVNGHVPLPFGTSGTNDATPSFRTASSDPNVSANMTSFLPISQAQAPPYALGPVNPFIEGTGNVTGNFTTTVTPPPGGFPLAGVIAAVAGATAPPPQLPLLIIAGFVILAASLTTTYLLRKYGSGSLLVKAFVIIGVMGVFIALGDFGIDFWMLIVFAIFATALAMMSRQQGWQ